MCGLRMGAHAGIISSGTFATVGRTAPWWSGTKTCGIFASASSRSACDEVLSRMRSTSTVMSSASPMMTASQKGASGSGFENVSGPPARMNGCWRGSRSDRSGGIFAASSMRTKPPISISYAMLAATTGNSSSGRSDS